MSKKLPIIAIIGRPNVGKSTLFNRVVGRRQALVDDQPGITRDRHYAVADWDGYEFTLIDTGGIETQHQPLARAVYAQTEYAIRDADCLWVVMDARSGLTGVDRDVIQMARKSQKPTFYILNKVDDDDKRDEWAADFAQTGIAEFHAVSSEHGIGVDDLLDATMPLLPVPAEEKASELPEGIRVAIVGRPNVGKSTLVNRLLGEDRVVVHDMAGTTRDTIDTEIKSKGDTFILVDTPGVKRKSKTQEKIEKFSSIKALQAAQKADIVLLVVDGVEGITHQDLQLCQGIWKKHKPIAIVVNKWDKITDPKLTPSKYSEYIEEQFREMRDLPAHHISALTGDGVTGIWALVKRIHKAAGTQLSTAKCNTILQHLAAHHHLPVFRERIVRLNYMTQVGVYPPKFMIFTNFPQGIPEAYRRYMMRGIQEKLGMPGLPVHLLFRRK